MKNALLLALSLCSAAGMMAQKGDDSAIEKFLPGTITEYDWRGTKWNLSSASSVTYDADGRITSETTKYQKTVYAYDSNGMVISQTVYNIADNGTLTPAQKVEYTYDPIVTNFKTSVTSSYWTGGNWKTSDASRKVITRDEKGNITKIENQDLENSKFTDADEYCVIEYGADGTASTITCYEEDYDSDTPSWEISLKLTDIVWDRTDGQITDIYDSDDLQDFYQGANRIKSATIAQGDYPGVAYLTVTYDGEYDYDSRTTYAGSVVDYEKFSTLDQYGSYTLEAFYTDFDYDDDKQTWENDGSFYYNETKKYDKFGLTLEESEEDLDANGKITSADYERGEVSYDSETGLPTEYIVQRKTDKSADYSNDEKYVYSDYSAGIWDIEADSEAETEYFDINGARVNPSDSYRGILILRSGNKSAKIIR